MKYILNSANVGVSGGMRFNSKLRLSNCMNGHVDTASNIVFWFTKYPEESVFNENTLLKLLHDVIKIF